MVPVLASGFSTIWKSSSDAIPSFSKPNDI